MVFFLRKYVTAFSRNYFCKKTPRKMFDRVLNTPLKTARYRSSHPELFRKRNISKYKKIKNSTKNIKVTEENIGQEFRLKEID